MREYGKVYTSFWSDPTIRAMSEDARALALYLLTCQHGNSIGLFRLPDAYAADDLQWPIERVSKAFQNLIDSRFLVRETASNWLVIPKYTKWNGFENPKVAIGAMKVLESCPDGDAKRLCAQSILQYGAHLTAEFRNRLDTLSKEYRNKEPSQSLARAKPEPEPEPEPSQSRSGVPAAPPRPAERPASKTDATWKAYSAAYLRTYGAEPVRNAKVNGQLANVVDRIGGDDAPLVAEWFVHHRKRWYVEKGHSVECLQKDCEQLRTEWATGRRSTSTAALQADRTQTTADVFGELYAEAVAAQEANHATG
jgi:hypothetical protein